MTDILSPAELARDEMAAQGVQVPTLRGLALRIRYLPDGPERFRLEDWYWALVVEKFGEHRANAWRWEYEWLRAQR